MIRVGQVMTHNLVTAETGTSVVEAAKLMRTHRVGSILVVERGQIIGIVTETDIVRKFAAADKVTCFTPVEAIMSSPVVGIEERCPLTEAADLMHRHRTRHLGVMRGSAIVGMVS